MGLVEKRLAMTMEKDSLPAWQKMVTDACGAPVAFEVVWTELVKEKFESAYPKTVEYNFFKPLATAFGSICRDDLGKQALADRVKKVHVGSTRNWSSLKVWIEGDTLFLDADPSYARTENDTKDYAKRIQTALESAL
jgi:hypothetical protein